MSPKTIRYDTKRAEKEKRQMCLIDLNYIHSQLEAEANNVVEQFFQSETEQPEEIFVSKTYQAIFQNDLENLVQADTLGWQT